MAGKDFTIFSHLPMKLFDKYFSGKTLTGARVEEFMKDVIHLHTNTQWNPNMELHGTYAITAFESTVEYLNVVERELLKTDFQNLFKNWHRYRSKNAREFVRMIAGLYCGWMALLHPLMYNVAKDDTADLVGIPSNILRSVLRVAKVFIQLVRDVNKFLGKGKIKEATKRMADLMMSPAGRRTRIVFYQTMFILEELRNIAFIEFGDIEAPDNSSAPSPSAQYQYKNWQTNDVESGAKTDRFLLKMGSAQEWVHLRSGEYDHPTDFTSMTQKALNAAANQLGVSDVFEVVFDDDGPSLTISTTGGTPFTLDFRTGYNYGNRDDAGNLIGVENLDTAYIMGFARRIYTSRSSYTGTDF